MCDAEKRTEPVKSSVSERTFVALSKLAAAEDRSLSEYIAVVLSRHCFGNFKPDRE